jgi:D-alanyl-D-alanine carboxypeptidase
MGPGAPCANIGHAMAKSIFTRRDFLSKTSLTTLAATSTALLGEASIASSARAETPAPTAATPFDKKLDAYIAQYMVSMNAPGMTLGLTDASTTIRTAGYGFANVDQHIAVNPSHLFQIGSITKSFLALVLMQLRDEGKLDLQKPILDYLPWLPITEPFGPITTHHLLTHTSGLPDNLTLFPTNPEARITQGFSPGEHFHYCNAGFDILGELAVSLDKRPWRTCVQARIFDPLGMTETTGVITTSSRERAAIGYQPYWDDQVYPRQGKLAAAANLVMDDTAGCISSTPTDMARYLRLLLNRGMGPKSRLISEESFTLFSTPHIKAEEFSPTSSYGYGIAVDTLDGHKILRHTGGMVAFASSIHVDLDGGVAAFASINAMQGYRPTAVTEYAVSVLRAQKESKSLPEHKPFIDPMEIDNATGYAGTFTASDGSKLTFTANGKRLSLVSPEHGSIPLEQAGPDTFQSTIPGRFTIYPIQFGRKPQPEAKPAAKPETAVAPNAPVPPVVEVQYGPEWFTSAAYDGLKSFAAPAEFAAYEGHYRSDSAWGGDARVFVQKGKLTFGGTALTPIGGNLFRVGDEAWSPDTAEFHFPVEGKARLLILAGENFSRIDVG